MVRLVNNIRFAQEPVLVIENFQRAEQIVGGILRKREAVCPVIDQPKARGETVIQGVQFALKLLNLFVALLVQLRVNQAVHLIAQGNQALDALLPPSG